MLIAGVDEAGVSAIAGPVVAGAVVYEAKDLPLELEGIEDSKRVKRTYGAAGIEEWFMRIVKTCKCWSVASVSPAEIDLFNIHNAKLLAMAKAISFLEHRPQLVWVDGSFPIPSKNLPTGVRQIAQKKADETIWTCSAASIVAKHMRDSLMADMHRTRFPQYGFDANCGYRCECHFSAIRDHGLSVLHRRRFRDCKREHEVYSKKRFLGIDPNMALSSDINWFGEKA